MLSAKMIEIIVVIIAIVVTGYFYIKAKKDAANATNAQNEQFQKEENAKVVLTVKIDGMMCEKCAQRVTEGLSKFGEVSINLEEKAATIISDEMQDVFEIENTVNELGYKFEGIE